MVAYKPHIADSFKLPVHSFTVFLRDTVRESFDQPLFGQVVQYFLGGTSVLRYVFGIMIFNLKLYIAAVDDLHDVSHGLIYNILREDTQEPFSHLFICFDIKLIITRLTLFPLFKTKGHQHLPSQELFFGIIYRMDIVCRHDRDTELSCQFCDLGIYDGFVIDPVILDFGVEIFLSKNVDEAVEFLFSIFFQSFFILDPLFELLDLLHVPLLLFDNSKSLFFFF